MASDALFAGMDVHRVIELHELRQQVNFLPGNGLSRVVGFGQFLNPGTVGLNGHVTVHANVETGNRGMTSDIDTRVTVLTIDLHFSGVHLVRERERLVGLVALIISDYDFVIRQCPDKYAQATETKDDDQTKELFHEQDPTLTFTVDWLFLN
jgi:hypothetical protein